MEDCWAGACHCYLDILDKLQKWVCSFVGPALTAVFEHLAHRGNGASLMVVSKLLFGGCSSKLAALVPFSYSRERSTRCSNRFHDFSVTIPRCC